MNRSTQFDPPEFFKTEDDREAAVVHFRDLISNAGWKLLTKLFDAEIEAIKAHILSGIKVGTNVDGVEIETPEQAKSEEDRLRMRLQIIEDVFYTPEYYINDFTSTEDSSSTLDEDDPYETAEEIGERNKAENQAKE